MKVNVKTNCPPAAAILRENTGNDNTKRNVRDHIAGADV